MAWTIPKTWNVGDVLTSTDLNTYLRDNSNSLYGDSTNIAISLSANWSPGSSSINGVRKIAGGSIAVLSVNATNNTGGTVNSVSTIATIPAGYAPTSGLVITAAIASGTPVRADINVSGSVFLSSGSVPNGGYFALSATYTLL